MVFTPEDFPFFFLSPFLSVIFTLSFLGSKPRMEKREYKPPNEKKGSSKTAQSSGQKKIKKKKSTSSLGSREKKREEDEWPGLW